MVVTCGQKEPAYAQGVSVEDVLRVLRGRFGTSGIAEKEARAHRQ